MELNRTGSLWDRTNRNGINNNWGIIESFLTKFDGTKLYEISHNIYDNRNFGQGSIDRLTGAVNSDGFVHAIVNVEPNKNYTTEASGVGAYYTASGTYISGITSSSSSRRKLTTPANAAIMKLTMATAQLNTFMVYEGWDDKPYMQYGVIPSPLITDPELLEAIDDAKNYFIDFDSRRVNQGKDFPLKSVDRGSTPAAEISERVRNIVLDAKVFGGKADMYYRLSFIGNGIVQGGAPRYGITLEERRIGSDTLERFVFVYNDATTPENQQNYNVQKGSDGIDTVIVDNGEIAVSVTIDREALGDSTFLNINTTSPTAVIDPMLYFP